MDIWEPIPEFPNYLVSNRGLILNEKTGRVLTLSTNQRGIVHVGLMRSGVQHKRSVAVLVANAFLPQPPPRFDTPIHLNGNRDHNFVENLLWRPRPFALMYRAQLFKPYPHRIESDILNVMTGEVFENSIKAATRHGVLERAVVMSIMNDGVPVFPTGHTYRLNTF